MCSPRPVATPWGTQTQCYSTGCVGYCDSACLCQSVSTNLDIDVQQEMSWDSSDNAALITGATLVILCLIWMAFRLRQRFPYTAINDKANIIDSAFADDVFNNPESQMLIKSKMTTTTKRCTVLVFVLIVVLLVTGLVVYSGSLVNASSPLPSSAPTTLSASQSIPPQSASSKSIFFKAVGESCCVAETILDAGIPTQLSGSRVTTCRICCPIGQASVCVNGLYSRDIQPTCTCS